jgi:hypothetical protein
LYVWVEPAPGPYRIGFGFYFSPVGAPKKP